MKQVTGQQVKDAMIAGGITRVDHHDCGICGVMVFYFRDGEQLYFNSGCGCCWSPPQPRDWEEVANWINMQNDEWRKKIMLRFGLNDDDAPTPQDLTT